MLRICLLSVAGWLALACSSAPRPREASAGTALRVLYVDYRNQTLLELVSTAHTDRLEQYSTVRANAGRKVQSNEVMEGLVEFLDTNGFRELARPGAAPSQADGRGEWSLEIERPGELAHVTYPFGLPVGEKQRYGTLWQAFLDTYNATYGLQAVEIKAGETPFATPQPPKKRTH